MKFHLKGSLITRSSYAETIQELHKAINEKRKGKVKYQTLLLHNNAPPYMVKVTRQAIQDSKFEKLLHPPYSPDLAPSNYYLFRHLKKSLCGRRFEDNNEVMSAVRGFFKT